MHAKPKRFRSDDHVIPKSFWLPFGYGGHVKPKSFGSDINACPITLCLVAMPNPRAFGRPWIWRSLQTQEPWVWHLCMPKSLKSSRYTRLKRLGFGGNARPKSLWSPLGLGAMANLIALGLASMHAQEHWSSSHCRPKSL
jgi:hypothetical protein